MSHLTTENVRDNASSTRNSAIGSEAVTRSNAWSADLNKNWNKPVAELETINERAERYGVYFTLDAEQLRLVMDKFIEEIDVALRLHVRDPHAPFNLDACSLQMLETCVTDLPTGREQGVAYALHFGSKCVRCNRVKFDGAGKVSSSQVKYCLKGTDDYEGSGLLGKNATATQLFDAFAKCTEESMTKQNELNPSNAASVGFCASFPITQKTLKSATLVRWTKGVETGRATNDKVEGMDVGALLDQAFYRNGVPAKQVAIINDTTATLLSCAYESNPRMPPCLIGYIIDEGVNGCFWQDDAISYGYHGCILNTELGSFCKGLPLTDVDMEVDFASESNRGCQVFEKMVGEHFLGELCRRLVLKVFQKNAPELAWVRGSMPTAACVIVANDHQELLNVSRAVLEGLWEWNASFETLQIVKELFKMVLDRSAALVAATIAGMAKRSGRLQPALGGVTVGIDGILYTENEWYAGRVRHHLNAALGDEIGKFVNLCVSQNGNAKGVAILSVLQKKSARR